MKEIIVREKDLAHRQTRKGTTLPEEERKNMIAPIIMGVNILVFAMMVVSGVSFLKPTSEQLLNWGANFGPLTVVSQEWWRLLSCNFVHAGIPHLAANMFCLWCLWWVWNLGDVGTGEIGNWTFLILCVLSGLGSSIASLWWNPTGVSAGASGAIFGVLGGWVAFFFLGELQQSVIKTKLTSVLKFVGYILAYVGVYVLSGLQSRLPFDHAGHLGGLATGLLLGVFLHRPLPATQSRPRLRSCLGFLCVALALILGAKLAKDESIASFQKALELDPTNAETQTFIGLTYEAKGDYERARSQYRVALRLEPDESFRQRQIAFTYFLERRFQEALEELDRYLGMVDSPPAYTLIWKHLFLQELGRHSETKQFLDFRAKRFDSEDWEAYLFRYHQDTVTQSQLLSKASNSGERCEAYFYIGYQYLLNGDNEKAREYFQKTIETKVDMYYEYTAARARLKQLDAR